MSKFLAMFFSLLSSVALAAEATRTTATSTTTATTATATTTEQTSFKFVAKDATKAPLTGSSLSGTELAKKLKGKSGKVQLSADGKNVTVLKANGESVTMTATEYVAELNALESFFNAAGYSMKQGAIGGKVLQVVSTPGYGVSKFEEQKSAMHARFVTDMDVLAASNMLFERTESGDQPFVLNSGARRDVQTLSEMDGAEEHNHEVNETLFEVGDRDTFKVAATFVGKAEAMHSVLDISTTVNADVYIFGSKLSVAEMTAKAKAKKNEHAVKMQVSTYRGDWVDDEDVGDGEETVEIEDDPSESVDKSYEVSFAVGPIPVSATLGARGTVGMDYELSADTLKVMTSVTPSFELVAYAQAGVDMRVVEVGAGSSLTIIDAELPLVGSLEIVDATNPGGSFGSGTYVSEFSGATTIEALAGRVYLYAAYFNPFCWCDDRAEAELFDWNGFSDSGTLFYEDESTAFD